MKVECLNVCACALEQSLDLFPFQQWKQLLLVMKIIGIVKGLLLFVYINNKKIIFAFFLNKKKIECIFLPSALISRSTIMNKLCIYSKKHWVQNNTVWAGKRLHLGFI